MQPKKLLIMNILDILKRYTDEDHRLSQKEIEEILENEYDMKTDRKSVKNRKYTMKSETSNNRINYKNEFIFGMIWGNGTQPRQLSVYKKDDVLLAVNKAYRDMIQHNMKGFGFKKVYELKCKTDKEKAKKRKDILSRKNEIVKELKEELAIKIIEIFNNEKFDDSIHTELCNGFKTSFKKKLEKLNADIINLMPDGLDAQVDINQVTFGLAQKIVNMSFKYLYLFDIKENKTSNNEHNIFENCHMPIDSYILSYLYKECKIKEITAKGSTYKLSNLKWSQLNKDQYEELRKSIKSYFENAYQDDRKFPLFTEFYIWPLALEKYAQKDPYKVE